MSPERARLANLQTHLRGLEAEAARLQSLRDELDAPNRTAQAARDELKAAAGELTAAASAWARARLAGETVGDCPLPKSSSHEKLLQRVAAAETADAAIAPVRDELLERHTAVANEIVQVAELINIEKHDILITEHAGALAVEISKAMEQLGRLGARYEAIDIAIRVEAQLRGGSPNPQATPYFRLLERLDPLPAAFAHLSRTEADVAAATRMWQNYIKALESSAAVDVDLAAE